ncbi:MAG: hypothetical protein M3309_03875 [Actinomycetota bacterium]|nr:hypothetical protein [Actinomycetota bacterium]
MSDPRGESSRDTHIQEAPASPGSGGERGDTRSVTYEADPSRREGMQQELMDLGVWLSEHPESRKNLKPIRGSVVLEPGVYYNTGTGMVERIYTPQHIALGARWFRVKSDPGAPVEEIRRKVLEGK